MNNSVKKELQKIVGAGRMADTEGARWAYAFNDFGSFFNPPFVGGKPDVIVKPGSTDEVAKILRLASDTGTPVVPAGGREGISGGAVPANGGILLDLTSMNKVISLCEKSSSVRVQAGITYTVLRDFLKKKGYCPGNRGPAGPMGGTVGGGISLTSTGIGGARYGQYGENVLALQVALPDGEIIETGSMSNPDCDWHHRYCCGMDTAGLFIGAAGTLGIVTEVALKIHKLPAFERPRVYSFTGVEAACNALHEQDSYEWLFNHMVLVGTHSIALTFPPGSPAAGLIPPEADTLVTIELKGHDEIILDRQVDIMDEIALRKGGTVVGFPPMPEDPLMVARIAGMGLTCYCETVFPISQVPEVCRYVLEEFVPANHETMIRVPGTPLPYWCLMLAGVTNNACTDFSFVYGVDAGDKETRDRALEKYHDLMAHIYGMGAAPHAMAKDMYTPHWLKNMRPGYAAFLKKIKGALDPKGILNPGSIGFD